MVMGVQVVFFFNDPATTEIYTLSLHDALPIYTLRVAADHLVIVPEHERELYQPMVHEGDSCLDRVSHAVAVLPDRKSTRLNSSHANISYAVFCLKKKNTLIPLPYLLTIWRTDI